MSLITEFNGSQDDIMRKGYKITGICLETNLRVNKRHVEVSFSKKISNFFSNALDHAYRRGNGEININDLLKIIIPVNNNRLFTTIDLDEQSKNVRLKLVKKFNLIPIVKNNYQFFIKLTLNSSDGVNRHQSCLLSYVSNRSDRGCKVYYSLTTALLHYDAKGQVVPLLVANNATPLIHVIDTITAD